MTSQSASTTIGFHCSHEQHGPGALLQLARDASVAGFHAAMCSDHFHPWSARQGHSGFTWAWLGSALQATSLSFGTVCAPGQRYHPAIIAQAAATLADMYPTRFWLAVGSGEAVNERITGTRWPPKAARHARLRQCVEIMRALWAGDVVTQRGPVRVERARLYSRPAHPPLLYGAALTPDTARWVGGWADGLITIAGQAADVRARIEAFRDGGGLGKPVLLQVALAFADTDEHAARAAHDQWRQAALPTTMLADLPTVEAFDQAVHGLTVADIVSRLRVSADIERHIAWLQEDLALGVSQLYLHNVVRNEQRRFLDACGERLLPALRR